MQSTGFWDKPNQQKIFIRHSVNLILGIYDDIIENMFIQYLYNVLQPTNVKEMFSNIL